MASPEEVAAPAAFSYSSTNGGECQYAASAAMTAKTKTSITKRKRTKRGLRSLISSPPRPAPAPDEEVEEEYFSTSPTTTTTTTTTTTEEEEEDMAHCLILLAQGRTAASSSSSPAAEDPGLQSTGGTTIKRFGGTTTACSTAGDTLHAVYECKTCNKRFPSFQALGGHRASHKKPKQLLLLQPVPAVKVDAVDMDLDDVGLDITMNSSSFARIKPALTTAPPAAAPVPANKLSSRVHECSICGSEFASGQALGGHMRRHRPVLGAPESLREAPNSSSSGGGGGGGSKKEEKKCMLLSLDLNLPAPSEENAPNSMAGTFTFVDHRPLALVDCHY